MNRTTAVLAALAVAAGLSVDRETLRLIRVLRESGLSWAKIAERLAAEDIPTSQGGQWHASTVRKLALGRQDSAA